MVDLTTNRLNLSKLSSDALLAHVMGARARRRVRAAAKIKKQAAPKAKKAGRVNALAGLSTEQLQQLLILASRGGDSE